MNKIFKLSVAFSTVLMLSAIVSASDKTPDKHINTPVMGWSSWNTYHVDISDSLIKSQADAMVRLGLKDTGYTHINIDDGFFGGRDEVSGKLLIHSKRFPNWLKPVADYIHSIGLKVGLSLLIGDLKFSPIDGVVALPNICLGCTLPHFRLKRILHRTPSEINL